MAVLALVGPFIYNFLTRKADNILLAEQKQYQKVLQKLAEGMVQVHNLEKLLRLIVVTIKKYVKVSYAAAYLDDPENKRYVLKAESVGADEDIPEEYSYEHPFIKYVKTKEMPLLYEEMPEEIKTSLNQTPAERPARRHGGIGLVVPSVMNQSVLGFLVMGHKEDNRLYNQGDVNSFKTLSNTAAVAVDNCRFTEKSMKSKEAELDAESQAQLGAMAAGTAHQFRNLLNIFALIGMNMEMETGDVEELVKTAREKGFDFGWFVENRMRDAKSIGKNVKRGTEIVEGVAAFSMAETEGITKDEHKLSDMFENFANTIRLHHDLAENAPVPLKSGIGQDDLIYCSRPLLFLVII